MKGYVCRGRIRTLPNWVVPAFVLLLAVGLRVAYLYGLIQTPAFRFPAVDAGYHDAWARALAFGDWHASDQFDIGLLREIPYFRPPGYPYFLALIYRVAGPGYLAPRLVQAALGLLCVWLAWRLGSRWGGPAVGGLWALLMATHPGFIYFEGELLESSLMIVLGLLMMSAFARVAERPRRALGACLLAGVLLGLQALTRPNVLLFAPVAALWVWRVRAAIVGPISRIGRFGGSMRRYLTPSALLGVALLTAGVLLAVLPVTVRNRIVGGEWVLISTNGGINLYLGNNDQADGLFLGATSEFGHFASYRDYERIVANLSQREGRDLDYREVDRYFTRRALDWIGSNPGRALRLMGRKALYLVAYRETGHNRSIYYDLRRLPVIRRLPRLFTPALALAVGGMVLLWRRSRHSLGDHAARRLAWLVAGFTLVFAASYVPFFVTAQYRLPLEPWLLGAAAWTVGGVMRLRRRLTEVRLATPVGVCFWLVVAATTALSALNWNQYEPNEAKWHFDQGRAWEQNGDLERAEAEYRHAMRANPQLPHPFHNLALLQVRRGHLLEAEALFRRALALGGSDRAGLLSDYGNCLLRLGRSGSAVQAYREALGIDPNRLDTAYNLAEAHLMLGDLIAAEALLATIISRAPERVRARQRLGQVRALLESNRHLPQTHQN